jgi:hypothetical protein
MILCRDEQSQTENEKRRREAIEMRSEKNEHMRVTIAQDNERLLHMLKEAEDARTTIEQVPHCLDAPCFLLCLSNDCFLLFYVCNTLTCDHCFGIMRTSTKALDKGTRAHDRPSPNSSSTFTHTHIHTCRLLTYPRDHRHVWRQSRRTDRSKWRFAVSRIREHSVSSTLTSSSPSSSRYIYVHLVNTVAEMLHGDSLVECDTMHPLI